MASSMFDPEIATARHVYRLISTEPCFEEIWLVRFDEAVAAMKRLLPNPHHFFDCRKQDPDEDWNEIEITDAMALRYMFAAGWECDSDLLDRLLAKVWTENQEDALVEICQYSAQLPDGGLSEQQARTILERMVPGQLQCFLGSALNIASFRPSVFEDVADEIRQTAIDRCAYGRRGG